ncbi:MAG: RloB family protein [Candidatus Wallbacteria bacterium]|nr:RloB family protein [Candidatus Wallbacteria bacterium]
MGNDQIFHKKKKAEYSRNENRRGKPRGYILIVCEGEKTEPNYFNAFQSHEEKRSAKWILEVEGPGYNSDSLVREAKRLFKDKGLDKKSDVCWVVFDRDNVPKENFNRAFALAARSDIRTAFSNEAFELWYLLHFNYYDTGMSRSQYSDKLCELLEEKYFKNSDKMYEKLLPRQGAAIKNAKKLMASRWEKDGRKSNAESDNPSTSVHLLVEELNKKLEK